MLVSPVTLILDHAQNRIALRDPRLALPFTYPLLAATGSTLGQTMSVYTFLSQPQARDSRSHVLFSSLSSVESGGAEALKTCFFLSVYTVVQSPEGPGPSFFWCPSFGANSILFSLGYGKYRTEPGFCLSPRARNPCLATKWDGIVEATEGTSNAEP